MSRDVAPIGNDIEPVEVPRDDVGMGNDEDEESLEADVPRVRMSPKNTTNREKQEHEDSGHAVLLVSKEKEWVDNTELNS